MRERSSFAILEVLGVSALTAAFGLMSFASWRPALAESSIVIEIPDHPSKQKDGEAAQSPAKEEAATEVAQDLLIADEIKERLAVPGLRNGRNTDDFAAVETFYKAWTGPALWLTTTGLSDRGKATVSAIRRADDWGLDPTLFHVPPDDYRPQTPADQAATELAISLAALKYARAARGGLSETRTGGDAGDRMPALRPPDDVLKELSTAAAPDAVLLDLHPKHKQFARLRQALLTAKSEQEDLLLRRNMDRWRRMPESLGLTYVWLNIPEFMVHAVDDGKTVLSEKVVVGGASSPTPVLSADLTEIVVNPERVVPFAVIRKDILPRLQGRGSFFGGGDTGILDKYGITVKRGGRTVDPGTIDWRKVNASTLTFVQKPGRTNIMGKVQFLYPNGRDVFMSGTALRGAFARDDRAQGPKDPRVDNAPDLAARLLAASNGESAEKVKQQIASGKTSRIKLAKPIPIYMTYFTAVVDETGKVTTFGDVYKLDNLAVADDDGAASQGSSQDPSQDSLQDSLQDMASPPQANETPRPARKPINGSLATTVR